MYKNLKAVNVLVHFHVVYIVDLQAAVALLYKWQCTDGLFLIRTSTRAWGVHVLTMAVRNTPYHFQIKNKVC